MKLIAVGDNYMSEKYYYDCVAQFPEYELQKVLFFGSRDPLIMRRDVYKIERGGPDAVEPPEELYSLIEDADALMVHLCPVSSRLLDRAKKLKIIMTNRGGTENVDIAAATARGIPVLANPAHNANAVAEYTVGLMLAETRNIARTHAALKNGIWRERFPDSGSIFELKGQTLGIVGFGNIGRLVAQKLYGFQMKFLVYDPNVSPDDPDLARFGCVFTDLKTVLCQSDFVSIHARVPVGQPIIDKAEFDLLKPTAFFINTARPHLINNGYLAEILREGRIAGAAVDVFMTEPADPAEPLLGLDNITLSNHRGGDTVNSYADSPVMLFEESRKLFAGGEPRFWKNREQLEK